MKGWPAMAREAALVVAVLFLACDKAEVPAVGEGPRPSPISETPAPPAPPVPASDTTSPPWRKEMEREMSMPQSGLWMGELTGRIAFASTRSGPHTVFTLALGAASEPQRLVYGMEPAWSPDGSSIAFVSSYFDGGDEVAVMNADGSNVRRLTTAEGQDRGPSWSPDGRSIAFWSERDNGEREIYVVNADGSSLKRLTSNSATDMWPAWSRDGEEVAFESYRGDGAELFAVSVRDGRERRLTPAGLDAREPAWSPDGFEILFLSSTSRGWALVVMSADGRRFRKVVEGKSIRTAAWSPDGRFLVFAHTPEGAVGEDICVVDAAGSRLANLTKDGGYDWDPSWTR